MKSKQTDRYCRVSSDRIRCDFSSTTGALKFDETTVSSSWAPISVKLKATHTTGGAPEFRPISVQNQKMGWGRRRSGVSNDAAVLQVAIHDYTNQLTFGV